MDRVLGQAPRDVIEVRNPESDDKPNATDVAFEQAKIEAESSLKAIKEAQDREDEVTKKEQCVEAILKQSLPMRADDSSHLDKVAAEVVFGRKAADFAFRKLVKSGQLVATGNTRNRRYAYPSNVTHLVVGRG